MEMSGPCAPVGTKEQRRQWWCSGPSPSSSKGPTFAHFDDKVVVTLFEDNGGQWRRGRELVRVRHGCRRWVEEEMKQGRVRARREQRERVKRSGWLDQMKPGVATALAHAWRQGVAHKALRTPGQALHASTRMTLGDRHLPKLQTQ
jgi:hypothetical protein